MSAPSNAGAGSRLDWLLVDFARETPGVTARRRGLGGRSARSRCRPV